MPRKNSGSTEGDQRVREVIANAPAFDLHSHLGRFFTEEGDAAKAVEAMRAGGLSGCVASAIGDLPVLEMTERGLHAHRPPRKGELFAATSRQLDRLDEAAHRGGLEIARSARAIREAVTGGRMVLVAGIEGGDFLDNNIGGVEWAHGRGVRLIQLVHYRINALGDIQTEEPRYRGLTRFGAEVVAEMDRLGMVIDVAHATFEVTKGVAETSRNPILLSHSLIGDAHPRMISADHAKVVADTGGVVGAWPSGLVTPSFESFVDGIVRLVETVGVDHVGIGTDQGAVRTTVFGDYARFDLLVESLMARGLSAEDTGKVIGGNFLRLFERVTGSSFLRAFEEIVAG